MPSENPSCSVDEIGLENVELHRVERMSDQSPKVIDKLEQQASTTSSTSPASDKKDSATGNVGSRIKSFFTNIPSLTAEIVLFLYMFSYIMRGITSTTLIIDKVCLVHLGYPEDVCGNLREHPIIKSEVTKMANNYGLGRHMLQFLPSSLMALFIGSWSDKYGRKFPMMLALIGIILDGFGSTLCAYFLYSRVEFYLIPAVFTGISGGFIGVLTILYSYASDTSTAKNRTMKFAFMQLAFGMSMPAGSLVGGWVFKFYGYVPVYAASTCGHVLGLCVVIFFLKETRGLEVTDTWLTKFRSFWSLEGVKSSFRATKMKRANKGRTQIVLLIVATSILILSLSSLSGINFFYVHYKFDWDNTWYSTVNSIYMVIGFAVMMTIVPLTKKMKSADPVLGILGAVSMMLRNVVTGLANQSWMFHVAMVSGLFSNLGTLSCRSRISKIVPKNDLGKVFAFVSTTESLLPIAASTVVSQAFNATLDFFPGLIYIVMGSLLLIPVGIFIWIFRLPARGNEVKKEVNKNDQEATVQASEEPSSTRC